MLEDPTPIPIRIRHPPNAVHTYPCVLLTLQYYTITIITVLQ